MNQIRIFLWLLTSALVLHAFIHADDYGINTVFGGLTLSLSILTEQMSESARSLWTGQHSYVGIPRALVKAALRETALHGDTVSTMKLQDEIGRQHGFLAEFHGEHITWLLSHGRILDAMAANPVVAESRRADMKALHSAVAVAEAGKCYVFCGEKTEKVRVLRDRIREVEEIWSRLFDMDTTMTAREFMGVTSIEHDETPLDNLSELYDIENVTDVRLGRLLTRARSLSLLTPESWLHELVSSLLVGEIWASCIRFIRSRENRLQQLLVTSGVQTMWDANDRILNVSRKIATTKRESRLVEDWCYEMIGWRWWLGEEIPHIIQRCLGYDGGDCVRIGPTEITALSDQIVKREQIMEDWTRRICIGLWNGMPMVGLLFVFEVLVSVKIRRVIEVPVPLLKD
jgi:hypothetical protein